jgi:phage-related baseplate assembly protein
MAGGAEGMTAMAIESDSFTGVDLSRLPAPSIIEPLSFEQIRGDCVAQYQALFPDFDATVESDPIIKLIELFAYRELHLRHRVNDAARAVMPAYATGADLDAIAAIVGVERFILDPGDPLQNVPPTYESDADFRRRMVLAPEGFSVAGPAGAYIFHALSADSDVRDASIESPAPGQVVVTILSRSGDGTADPGLLATVFDKLNADTVRPLTDLLTVQSATIVPFAIEADIFFLNGPDQSLVTAQAQARLDDFLGATLRLGRDVNRAGIIAALHAEGVQNVILTEPAADIVITRAQAGSVTTITLNDAGVAE